MDDRKYQGKSFRRVEFLVLSGRPGMMDRGAG